MVFTEYELQKIADIIEQIDGYLEKARVGLRAPITIPVPHPEETMNITIYPARDTYSCNEVRASSVYGSIYFKTKWYSDEDHCLKNDADHAIYIIKHWPDIKEALRQEKARQRELFDIIDNFKL